MSNANRPQDASPDVAASSSSTGTPALAPGQSRVPRRSLAPDIARGMMLLFIALANVSWLLWNQPAGLTSAHPTEGSTLDQVLQMIMMIAVDHRALPMFAFLFGYGIIQFMNSRLDRGIPETTIRTMLRRRHWWLVVFGLLHAGLLFYGDVLGTYGLTALVLMWLFFRRPDITLKVWSSIGLGLILIFAVLSILGGAFVAALGPEGATGSGQGFSPTDSREATMGEPNYLVSILARLGTWAVLTPSQIIGLVVPVCILLGWLAARRRVLDNPAEHRKTLIRIAAIGIPIGWLGGVPSALAHTGMIDLPEAAGLMFFGLAQFTGIFCGIGYAAVFGLIALRWQRAENSPVILRALSAVGQRSLTFYLWQAVVLVPLLAAWGLGVGAHIGAAGALGIAVLVWLAGIVLAVWMDRTNRRGPAEWLLRRLTYGKHDALPSKVRKAPSHDNSDATLRR